MVAIASGVAVCGASAGARTRARGGRGALRAPVRAVAGASGAVPGGASVYFGGAPRGAWAVLGRAARPSAVGRARATAEADTEYEFQAETSRLLDLIVNSLYSSKEIFLRELVSNASDALDKCRFRAIEEASIMDAESALEIRVKGDPEGRTLTIKDTGVGLTREEMQLNLGTIARSGTAQFAEALKEAKKEGDAGDQLIGRFGVGFYSAFLVADKVTVRSRAAGSDEQWKWECGKGSTKYALEKDDGEPLTRGTEIVLHLAEGEDEYADEARIKGLVRTYSEFINFPIKLWTTKEESKEVPDEDAPIDVTEVKEGEEAPKPKMKTVVETKTEWTVVNDNKPIWMRDPKDVSDEDYNGFFKAHFKEFVDPIARSHFSVEGQIEFKALLYIPGMKPFDMMGMGAGEQSNNISLYVKRVFISSKFDEDLMPRYLNFVKGVVDSDDLPLNVSREILQESKAVRIMRKRLVRKSIDMMKDLAKEGSDAYKTFYENFGQQIKLGCIEDMENKKELAKLLRFASTTTNNEDVTSLADYVARMPEGQKDIYFVAADSREAARRSPFLERMKSKGYEVLFMLEPIDEVAMNNLGQFDGKDIVDVSKDNVDLDTEEDKGKNEEAEKELKVLTDWLKEQYGEKVENIRVTTTLVDTPCVLVTSKFGWSANMERIMKAQTMADGASFDYMKGRKSMEVNARHPVIRNLKKKVEADPKDPKATTLANLLWDTALISSGFNVENTMEFAKSITSLMTDSVADAKEE